MALGHLERSAAPVTHEVQLSARGIAALGEGAALGTVQVERGPAHWVMPAASAKEADLTQRPDSVVDFRDIPLAELAGLDTSILNLGVGRVLPNSTDSQVPVAAFQSSV